MTSAAAKRVDSLYRNLRSLPLLTLLSVVVPPLLVVLLPVGIGYWALRRGVIRDNAAGQFPVEPADRRSAKPGDKTTEQKLDYILHRPGAVWVPLAVGAGWLILLAAGITFVTWTDAPAVAVPRVEGLQ